MVLFTFILPLFSPSHINFRVTEMAAFSEGECLVLNEFEDSYLN